MDFYFKSRKFREDGKSRNFADKTFANFNFRTNFTDKTFAKTFCKKLAKIVKIENNFLSLKYF